MWKGTSKAAGLQKTWPQNLWFFSRWPVTSPRDSCTCINTTSHTGRNIFCHMKSLKSSHSFLTYIIIIRPLRSLVTSWNNILVLPECSLQTPASVILLQALILLLQNSTHTLPAVCSNFYLFIINNEEHKNIIISLPSFLHSDLALRNCLLSANVSVKIGDYGLSHLKYKVSIKRVWFMLCHSPEPISLLEFGPVKIL